MTAPRAAVLAVLIPTGLALMISGPVAAEPLDPEECAKLVAEHKEMVGTGIEAELTKGPEWAVANLGEEGLKRIRHFLMIEEQLRFRCPPVQSAASDEAGSSMPLPQRNPEREVTASKAGESPTGSVERKPR